jgi:quinol monooxygenase YgiN
MPALPWTTGPFNPTEDRELHVLTSTLPLTRYRDVPRFLRWAMQIRKQLATTEGCAGYSLDARLLRKTFYTLSAWQDRDAMNRFVRSGRHAAMLADMAGRLGQSTFVESSINRTGLPLDWPAAKQRLATHRPPR